MEAVENIYNLYDNKKDVRKKDIIMNQSFTKCKCSTCIEDVIHNQHKM